MVTQAIRIQLNRRESENSEAPALDFITAGRSALLIVFSRIFAYRMEAKLDFDA